MSFIGTLTESVELYQDVVPMRINSSNEKEGKGKEREWGYTERCLHYAQLRSQAMQQEKLRVLIVNIHHRMGNFVAGSWKYWIVCDRDLKRSFELHLVNPLVMVKVGFASAR